MTLSTNISNQLYQISLCHSFVLEKEVSGSLPLKALTRLELEALHGSAGRVDKFATSSAVSLSKASPVSLNASNTSLSRTCAWIPGCGRCNKKCRERQSRSLPEFVRRQWIYLERYLHSSIQLEGGKMTIFITFAATEQSPHLCTTTTFVNLFISSVESSRLYIQDKKCKYYDDGTRRSTESEEMVAHESLYYPR